MITASRKFTVTPPSIIIKRCQVGFERNSQGFGSSAICALSIDSSIMPEILTYPPNGSQPMPYSVSPIFFLKRANLMSKNRKNFYTRVPKRRAGIKCPNSCRTMSSERLTKNWMIWTVMTSFKRAQSYWIAPKLNRAVCTFIGCLDSLHGIACFL